jgi:RNA 3'-terminal phosphate cyclase
MCGVCAGAVAQRVVDQVAQQLAHAHVVGGHAAQAFVELQGLAGIGPLSGHQVAHQRGQVHRFGVQRGVAAGQVGRASAAR